MSWYVIVNITASNKIIVISQIGVESRVRFSLKILHMDDCPARSSKTINRYTTRLHNLDNCEEDRQDSSVLHNHKNINPVSCLTFKQPSWNYFMTFPSEFVLITPHCCLADTGHGCFLSGEVPSGETEYEQLYLFLSRIKKPVASTLTHEGNKQRSLFSFTQNSLLTSLS